MDEQELKNEYIDPIPGFSHAYTRVLLVSSGPGWASLPEPSWRKFNWKHHQPHRIELGLVF